jgi:hypothetical protein
MVWFCAAPLVNEATANSAVPIRNRRLRPKVADPASEQKQSPGHQGVAVDDPRQGVTREVQGSLDGGQRDVHDRDVDDDHELHEGQDEQRLPPPRIDQPPFSFRRRAFVVPNGHQPAPFDSIIPAGRERP